MTDREAKLHELLKADVYWTARAMREQGSHFFQKLGEALERADAANRRKLYETWTDETHDFLQRGRLLAEREGDT